MFSRLLSSGRFPLYRLLPRRGPFALIRVFGPYVVSLVLLVTTRAGRQRMGILHTMLLASAAASMMRRANRRQAGVDTSGARALHVMSWNILYANPQSDSLPRFFAASGADLIAIQELTSAHVQALGSDHALREQFPHQILWDYGIGAGMGLLSRFPILEQGRLTVPPVLWARIDPGVGEPFLMVSGHPTFSTPRMWYEAPRPQPSLPIRIVQRFDLRFLWYDPEHRDDGIARVRRFIDPLLRQGERLLLVGDFNVTEREHGYDKLCAGLQDVYRAVGRGSGATWRPERIAHLPLPILRIDYMLSSPTFRPLRMWVDRTPRGSDHCPIHALFELPVHDVVVQNRHAEERIQ